MSNNRKKQEKKLRKQRKERKAKAQRLAGQPLAYHGRKYRTDVLAMVHACTEGAILAAWGNHSQLTDGDVTRQLEKLILGIRQGQIDWERLEIVQPEPFSGAVIVPEILANWQIFSEVAEMPSRDTMIGVLRTLLGSVEDCAIPGNSHAYLEFLVDFLGQMQITKEPMPAERIRHFAVEYAILAGKPAIGAGELSEDDLLAFEDDPDDWDDEEDSDDKDDLR